MTVMCGLLLAGFGVRWVWRRAAAWRTRRTFADATFDLYRDEQFRDTVHDLNNQFPKT
jgi:hypothetical protein